MSTHAAALFGAISIALAASGCGGEPAEGTGTPSVSAAATSTGTGATAASAPASAEPAASATVSATAATPSDSASATAATPSASASAAPQASALASAAAPSASATAKPKPRPRPTIVEGRPFLVDDVARVAALGAGPAWADEVELGGVSPGPEQRAELVRHFTQWSLAEHASIASFARFALQLLALGAPPELISRATSAMADETRHARLGFGLIAALSGEPLRPAELRVEGALAATSLEEVLRLTVREGVIGETLAALEARVSADTTSIPWMKEQLVRLADDEARHAELAYVFAAWAVARAPELSRVVEEELETWQHPPLEVVSGLETFGVLDTATRRAVQREGLAHVVRPLARRLAHRDIPRREGISLPAGAA